MHVMSEVLARNSPCTMMSCWSRRRGTARSGATAHDDLRGWRESQILFLIQLRSTARSLLQRCASQRRGCFDAAPPPHSSDEGPTQRLLALLRSFIKLLPSSSCRTLLATAGPHRLCSTLDLNPQRSPLDAQRQTRPRRSQRATSTLSST